ncbi:MAG: hypothetical protein ABSB66_08180 [Candidatus Acidiferrales bacterium]|jgi:hypothetical protein
MTDDHTNKGVALRRALGASKPPERITQEAFEGDNRHLRRLARLAPNERANASDLWTYTQDLRYTKIQGPLLAYLLPFCLEAWRDDLRGFDGYGGFVEHLYPVLADRHVFDVHLTPKQTEAVSTFMRESILEEIDEQRGLAYQGMNARPYRWIRALTSYGVLLPDVQRIWTAWWSLDTIGRAIAAVQYISCLMYSENENPVFSPWTQDGGGGPPCLWGFEGHLYEHRWLEPNVTFLKGTLNATGVSEVLSRAVERLTGQPEHEVAARVLTDLPLCITTLESRCAELPLLLQTAQQSTSSLEWSI